MKTLYQQKSDTLIPPKRGVGLFWTARKKVAGYSVISEVTLPHDIAMRLIGPECGLKIDAEMYVRDLQGRV